jgi:hypothetical protein
MMAMLIVAGHAGGRGFDSRQVTRRQHPNANEKSARTRRSWSQDWTGASSSRPADGRLTAEGLRRDGGPLTSPNPQPVLPALADGAFELVALSSNGIQFMYVAGRDARPVWSPD